VGLAPAPLGFETSEVQFVICTCALDPVIVVVHLLDSFALSPYFCVRMYPYYTRHPSMLYHHPSPSRLLRVRLLHSPSNSWVSTAFYTYCVQLIVSEIQHKPYRCEMDVGFMRNNKRSSQGVTISTGIKSS